VNLMHCILPNLDRELIVVGDGEKHFSPL